MRSNPPLLSMRTLAQTAPTAQAHGRVPWAARTVLAVLRRLQHGCLDLRLPGGEWVRFGQPSTAHPHATLCLSSWQPLVAALRGGDIGFAETFLAAEWTTPDLTALLRLAMVNRDALQPLVYGKSWAGWMHRLRHLRHRNTREGSRRNIHAHYDLGNAFYRLWLDDTMSYSSGWFGADQTQSTEAAQQAKMRRALQQCGAGPGARVLEVGCGWGALADCAVHHFGSRVTGVTLSTEQLAFARARLAASGASSKAELRLQDYRDIDDEPFEAIVSIEMFEAVGHAYWPSFFALLRDRLKPGGRACIQSITIRDDLFARYLSGTDFIQQYVFPGGLLPSRAAFRAEAERAGLVVVDELAFGPDYAETLRRWQVRFQRQEAAVLQLGFDRRFLRTWNFYLAYCEAAFATGQTDVVQFTLQHRR